MVNSGLILIICNRSYRTDEEHEYKSSVEVPIGDGTLTIYGTALDACSVRTSNMP